MSRTRRSTIHKATFPAALHLIDDELDDAPDTQPEPVDRWLAHAAACLALDAVVRAHRRQLVAAARHHLRNDRGDAEDLVQEVCVEALAGELALSNDPSEALDDLRNQVVRRCGGH